MKVEKVSKSWNWNSVENLETWMKPSEDSIYLLNKWKNENKNTFMDFGCGVGRHAFYFANNGFQVKAFDLSNDAVKFVEEQKGHLNVEVKLGDMHHVPFEDECVDCLIAYHVISHTNRKGIDLVADEIYRVLKKKGEFYADLCSKDGWLYKNSNYPKMDDWTVISQEEGPEFGIPHLCVDIDDLLKIFKKFELKSIKHTVSYDENGHIIGTHFWILGVKN